MKISRPALVFACLLLVGCGGKETQKWLLKKIVPPEDDLLARRSIELVRLGDFKDLRPLLDPSLTSTPDLDERLADVQRVLAQGLPIDTTLIGCQVNTINSVANSKRRSDISYELHFPHAWVAGDIVVDTENNTQVVSGIHFRQYPNSFEEMNRFSLQGKTPFHYLVLACCIAVPIFIVCVLIVCIRTGPIRRKWLWILFILFGVTQLQFNWTTAAWNCQPVSILLFGSSYLQSGPFAPWVLSFGFPLGAVIFLLRRKKLVRPPVMKNG